jgi:hypothetical protein
LTTDPLRVPNSSLLATASDAARLCRPLSCTFKGVVRLVGRFGGSKTLICQSPTSPGASPLKRTSAATPPIVTWVGPSARAAGPDAGWPSGICGLVRPIPVA